jgi:tetratricopeptide (TPR) repeat protein
MNARRASTLLALGGLLLPAAAWAQRTGANPAEADTQRCKDLFDGGDLGRAEKACSEALRRDGSYVPAWDLYLSVLIAERKEEQAISEAERAENTLSIREPQVLALHGAAIFQLAGRPAVDPKTQRPNKWSHQFAKALPYLERAAGADPTLLSAQAPLCAYWMAARDYSYQERSLHACQSALRQTPGNADLLVSIGYIHLNQARHAEALTACEGILRARSLRPELEYKAHACIGAAQAKKGDCLSARRTLEPLQKYATRGGAMVDLYLTRCAETREEAERYGREYMRISPNDAQGPLALAEAYVRMADRRRPPDPNLLGLAINELYKVRQLEPKRRDAAKLRARVFTALGRYVDAAAEWRPIFEEVGPADVEAVLGYGTTARRAGDAHAALAALEAGAKRNPENMAIRFELGRTQVESGDLSGGLARMESAVAADEGRDVTRRAEFVNLLVREGVKLARTGKASAAEPLLERAVHHDPGSVIANRDLGLVRLQQQRYAQAVAPLTVWRNKTVRDRDSNLILGRALAGVGKRDDAIKAYEQARESAQKSGQPLAIAEVLLELGPQYLAAGRHGDAVQTLELARDNLQTAMNQPAGAPGAASVIAAARSLEPVVRRNRALAYLLRGYDLVQKRNAAAGVADLRHALDDPRAFEPRERANAHCALALGLLGSGAAAEAVGQLQAAQKLGGCEFRAPFDKLGLDYWIAYSRYREGTVAGLNEALKVFGRAQGRATGELGERFKELTFTAWLKLMAEEYARGNLSGTAVALKNAQKAAAQVKDEGRKRELTHNMAVLELAQGRTAQARQQLEALGSRPPEALVNLGLIYERQGDIQKALALWQQSGRGGKVREWVDATRRFLGAAGTGAGGQP